MVDTQRWDMLGCYGSQNVYTPNLDRLASEGMRFEKAYTCQPVCGPARSAIFTGTFPHSNGVWTNGIAPDLNVKTIGKRLSDHGLHSAYVGKWHLDGGDYFGMGRCPEGWDPDYWYDMRNYLDELTPEEKVASRKRSSMEVEGITADFTFAHRCSNRAIDFLKTYSDEDFFLALSYDEPHDPSLCPPPYHGMHQENDLPARSNLQDTLADKPEHLKVWAGEARHQDRGTQQPCAQSLLDCNSFVDSEIGRVLDAIDQHVPDALIIYTSDHGDMLNSHCLHGKGPAIFDEITRIPLLVRWPEVVKAGGMSPHPVSHIDIVPTLMQAAGIPLPKLLGGNSLMPVLENPDIRINEHIFMEFGRFEIDHDGMGGLQPYRCVFDGRYKLGIHLLSSDELYDLQSDPEENVNLISSTPHHAVRNLLHDRLLKWMNDTRDPFRGYYWECRPWRTEAPKPSWTYTGMTRQREHEEYEPKQLDYENGLPMIDAVRKK